jgi:[CysO sulfur-carrier protein]-S-L-cysteine hydrolase
MQFRITRSAREAIVSHAREEAPLESCGLLIGGPEMVEEAVRTRNARNSPTAFLVEPADHFAAIRRVRAEGRAIVGAYHSHPRSPAVPSPVDLREAHHAEFIYVIVSLLDPGTPDVRAYRLDRERFVEAPLVLVA